MNQGPRGARTYRLRIPLEAPYRRRERPLRGPLRLLLYVIVSGLLAVSGCVTGQGAEAPLGVQDGYETMEVRRVAMIRAVADSRMGLDDVELAATLDLYERESEAGLGALGMEVVGSASVVSALSLPDVESGDIERSLAEIFDDPGDPLAAQERLDTITALGQRLDVQAVFVSRVVYHAVGMCEGSAESKFTPFVVLPDGVPSDPQVPCAVSHFEAKLIDARTGKAIWYNRALREVRAANVQAPTPDAKSNAKATVDLVLHQGPTSLLVLVQR